MMPERIQLKRTKGWRMPPNATKVDRSTKWGNPYRVGVHGTVEECVAAYRAWMLRELAGNPTMLAELRGRNIACWCPLPAPGEPDICHGAVLLELAGQ